MNRECYKYLFDIQSSIELIEKFIPEGMTYLEFGSDIKTKDAIERRLIIIAEALAKFEACSNTKI